MRHHNYGNRQRNVHWLGCCWTERCGAVAPLYFSARDTRCICSWCAISSPNREFRIEVDQVFHWSFDYGQRMSTRVRICWNASAQGFPYSQLLYFYSQGQRFISRSIDRCIFSTYIFYELPDRNANSSYFYLRARIHVTTWYFYYEDSQYFILLFRVYRVVRVLLPF